MTQQINISDETYNAIAAKHGDVAAFLEHAAKQAMADELSDSLAMIQESEADIAAGRTQDMREGLQEIADKHGLKISP